VTNTGDELHKYDINKTKQKRGNEMTSRHLTESKYENKRLKQRTEFNFLTLTLSECFSGR